MCLEDRKEITFLTEQHLGFFFGGVPPIFWPYLQHMEDSRPGIGPQPHRDLHATAAATQDL